MSSRIGPPSAIEKGRTAAMLTFRSHHVLLGSRALTFAFAVGLLGAMATTPAIAGDSPCASTRVANSLLQCEHCQTMKRLLNDDLVHTLSVDVVDTPTGVLVEIEAPELTDRGYLEEFVAELWTRRDHEKRDLSGACVERYQNLMQAEVEEAPTDTGFFLILRSDDPKVVDWLQKDARRTRDYVLTAASN